MTLALIFISGCVGTKNFQSVLPLKVSGKSSLTPQQALEELLGVRSCPFNIILRQADEVRPDYVDSTVGIKARGLGGLVLPLILEVKGIEVIERERVELGYSLIVRLDATVNGISPQCGKVKGYVKINEDNEASIKFTNFYCNWVLIGNVFVNMKLAIDTIDMERERFYGYYSLAFKGTGNAAGSGYFIGEMKGE